jgi:hypothetical protein
VRRGAILVAALAVAGSLIGTFACQVFVDVGGLSDGQCSTGRKACNGQCVSINDPTYGCGVSQCAPCVLLNAYAGCDTQIHQCVPIGCVGTYKNCPRDNAVLGCPTDLAHDPESCGGCGTHCNTPINGVAGCSAGLCAVGSCNAPYEDCNHLYDDGCETNLRTDPASCGGCGHACAPGQDCAGGVCESPDASDD